MILAVLALLEPTATPTPVPLPVITPGADWRTALTQITGAWPWIWPVIGLGFVISRGLKAWFPTGGSVAVQARDVEIERLRGLLKAANLDAGPSPTLPALDLAAGRPPPVAAILAIVAPVSTLADMVFWGVITFARAALKRVVGEEPPADTDTRIYRRPKREEP